MPVTVVTAPSGVLLDVDADVKPHLRVDVSDEDDLIGALLGAATAVCEKQTRRSFLTQTLRMSCDEWFPSKPKRLTRPPFVSVSAVRVFDWDNVAHVVDAAAYWFDPASGYIRFNPEQDLPDVRVRPVAGYEVDYVAGYGDTADVPQMYKQAVLLLIGHWYENREAALIGQGFMAMPLPFSVKALLQIDRGGWF